MNASDYEIRESFGQCWVGWTDENGEWFFADDELMTREEAKEFIRAITQVNTSRAPI